LFGPIAVQYASPAEKDEDRAVARPRVTAPAREGGAEA
jgi:hypothetical protein